MPFPLVAGALIGSALVGTGANIYSQYKQRELYRYQRAGYQRYYDDYVNKRLPKGRKVQYPELSYPGKIRALDTGISQSYAGSVGSIARFTGGLVGSRSAFNAYNRGFSTARTLYGKSGGHTSRWL